MSSTLTPSVVDVDDESSTIDVEEVVGVIITGVTGVFGRALLVEFFKAILDISQHNNNKKKEEGKREAGNHSTPPRCCCYHFCLIGRDEERLEEVWSSSSGVLDMYNSMSMINIKHTSFTIDFMKSSSDDIRNFWYKTVFPTLSCPNGGNKSNITTIYAFMNAGGVEPVGYLTDITSTTPLSIHQSIHFNLTSFIVSCGCIVEYCSNTNNDHHDNNNNRDDDDVKQLYLVNTTSLAAEVPMGGMAIYAMGKRSRDYIMRLLAYESVVKYTIVDHCDDPRTKDAFQRMLDEHDIIKLTERHTTTTSKGEMDGDVGAPTTTTLHVSNLTRNINEDHLYEIFGTFAEVVDVDLAIDDKVNLPKGYAHIILPNREAAKDALYHLNHAQIDGNLINIRFAHNSGGGGGGGDKTRDHRDDEEEERETKQHYATQRRQQQQQRVMAADLTTTAPTANSGYVSSTISMLPSNPYAQSMIAAINKNYWNIGRLRNKELWMSRKVEGNYKTTCI
ncbi:hypothetical protein FOZ62_027413 [Perkinsus olseni]|uniref:RRM domain-containing protein n=1 Tax=Perkinsus olseni TaxID=32597 RepID=A0A7J6TGI8_PEROL|nr:hypothetical protein FOZ62_027413 [Perkinsus olseni]